MTLRETFENLNNTDKEVIEEGFKENALGAIGGAAMMLGLATAAGIPQKAVLNYDIKQIVKTMTPAEQNEYNRLYKLDQQNGTNRSGSYMLDYIDNTVEDGKGTKMMNGIYQKIHGSLPQNSCKTKNFKY